MGANNTPIKVKIRLTLLCDDSIMDERTSDELEIRPDFAGLADWINLFDQIWALTPEAYGPDGKKKDQAWDEAEWDASWLINYRKCLEQHPGERERCRKFADQKRFDAEHPEFEHPEIDGAWF